MFSRLDPVGSQAMADITFDFKIISPDKKVVLEQKELAFYRGELPEGKLLIPRDVLDIAFDEAEPFGAYHIEALFYEKVSKRQYLAKTEIELIPFVQPESFSSEEAYSDWVMQYYQKPDPVRSFAGILYYVESDTEWIRDNLMTLAFHRKIFLDTPFLWDYYGQLYRTASTKDKKKMLLVAAVIQCKEKESFDTVVDDDFQEFYRMAKTISIPDTAQQITSGVQLDILWAEFFASGTYEPIRRIVSALALEKYEEVLEKVKNNEIEMSEEVEKQVMLGAVYGAAEWSLISNCVQFDLVYQYCQTIYEREVLDPEVKESLGFILAVAERKRQEQAKEKEPPKANH